MAIPANWVPCPDAAVHATTGIQIKGMDPTSLLCQLMKVPDKDGRHLCWGHFVVDWPPENKFYFTELGKKVGAQIAASTDVAIGKVGTAHYQIKFLKITGQPKKRRAVYVYLARCDNVETEVDELLEVTQGQHAQLISQVLKVKIQLEILSCSEDAWEAFSESIGNEILLCGKLDTYQVDSRDKVPDVLLSDESHTSDNGFETGYEWCDEEEDEFQELQNPEEPLLTASKTITEANGLRIDVHFDDKEMVCITVHHRRYQVASGGSSGNRGALYIPKSGVIYKILKKLNANNVRKWAGYNFINFYKNRLMSKQFAGFNLRSHTERSLGDHNIIQERFDFKPDYRIDQFIEVDDQPEMPLVVVSNITQSKKAFARLKILLPSVFTEVEIVTVDEWLSSGPDKRTGAVDKQLLALRSGNRSESDAAGVFWFDPQKNYLFVNEHPTDPGSGSIALLSDNGEYKNLSSFMEVLKVPPMKLKKLDIYSQVKYHIFNQMLQRKTGGAPVARPITQGLDICNCKGKDRYIINLLLTIRRELQLKREGALHAKGIALVTARLNEENTLLNEEGHLKELSVRKPRKRRGEKIQKQYYALRQYEIANGHMRTTGEWMYDNYQHLVEEHPEFKEWSDLKDRELVTYDMVQKVFIRYWTGQSLPMLLENPDMDMNTLFTPLHEHKIRKKKGHLDNIAPYYNPPIAQGQYEHIYIMRYYDEVSLLVFTTHIGNPNFSIAKQNRLYKLALFDATGQPIQALGHPSTNLYLSLFTRNVHKLRSESKTPLCNKLTNQMFL